MTNLLAINLSRNWQKIIRPGALILLLGLASFSARAAESQLQLEVGNIDWRGGTRVAYHVFDAGEYAQTIHFKVRLTGDPVPFFVTFGSVGAVGTKRRAALGGDEVEYQIYDSVARRTALRDLPAATANEVLRGTFLPGEAVKELSYVLVVPPEQVRPAGFYTDQLKITVCQGTPDNFIEKDTKTVVFSMRVDPVTEMSLGEPGAAFDPKAKTHRLEFGALDKGKGKAFDLRTRSNAGYHVTLESEHGGVMKHVDPEFSATIPYVLQVGNVPANVGRGRQTTLSRNHRLTDRNGDRHEIHVIIGEIGNAPAGTYRDNLTVTVISDN
jgi:spore coat protein U-like protein